LVKDTQRLASGPKQLGLGFNETCQHLRFEFQRTLGVILPNSTPSPGDVRVSGRAHTPSWVYRRRLTGRLWNTTSCLTAAPLTHSLTRLGIPETAHGPTLEYRQLPHGSSTHSLLLSKISPALRVHLAVQRVQLRLVPRLHLRQQAVALRCCCRHLHRVAGSEVLHGGLVLRRHPRRCSVDVRFCPPVLRYRV
jgi:hypothetical protein